MFGSGGGGVGGGGGGGGHIKRGKGGGGNNNHHNRNHHQNPQEMIHAVQQVPVMAPTQPLTHIQPIFQQFHQPPGMHPMFPMFTYLSPNTIHPGFTNAVPQTQYVFPRVPYTSSVPAVNLQTFSAIPQNLAQNHTSPNPLTPMRSSHGPMVVPTGTQNTLHAAHSSTSTTYKKRAHALEIIDPETRKNILEPWTSTDEVKKDKPVEEKKKHEPTDDSASKVDCQMQTDVPVKIIKPDKEEEKEATSTVEDGE